MQLLLSLLLRLLLWLLSLYLYPPVFGLVSVLVPARFHPRCLSLSRFQTLPLSKSLPLSNCHSLESSLVLRTWHSVPDRLLIVHETLRDGGRGGDGGSGETPKAARNPKPRLRHEPTAKSLAMEQNAKKVIRGVSATGRGLHLFTSQLNASTFRGLGGALRGC